MAPTKVAILDDYQGVADPFFAKLDSAKYEVVSLKDTALPYNHPENSQAGKDALVEKLKPFDVICTMRERTPFPAELIERLPSLKLLLTTAFRNRSLDLDALKARGIPVAGTGEKAGAVQKTPGTGSTTQHCITLILALARGVARDDAAVKEGAWQTGLATDLSGKTLGILGLGRLGSTVAKILNVALGMKIIAWSTNLTQEAADQKAREAGLPVEDAEGEKTFKAVSRDELFRNADVVSVHLVLSDRSRGIINAQDLAKMKPTSLFVNTSRGPLVVEKDILEHLKAGRIRGAAIDVFDLEPLPADSAWRSKNWGRDGSSQVLLTPHMGYVEEDTVKSWYEQQVENIDRWAANEPLQNVFT
ncbi:related to formate dehydrogenase [Fusarium torulosum]|uniref:Related to formate dehydrogenase n=1 Tax=Fusarium torulosum TaxID=33205 RepID=A0AAE8MJX7_9HYPO|nr:related to formate dehydrogenase [Fusarium torulosum]